MEKILEICGIKVNIYDFGDFVDGFFYPNRYNCATKHLAEKYNLSPEDYEAIATEIMENVSEKIV